MLFHKLFLLIGSQNANSKILIIFWQFSKIVFWIHFLKKKFPSKMFWPNIFWLKVFWPNISLIKYFLTKIFFDQIFFDQIFFYQIYFNLTYIWRLYLGTLIWRNAWKNKQNGINKTERNDAQYIELFLCSSQFAFTNWS